MDFKKLFFTSRKEGSSKNYLAVEIHEFLIKSAVWKINLEQQPEIVSFGSFEMWDSQESLINGIDASLTNAVKDLPNQPNEIILGLPEHWLEKDKIHPSKTILIKQILKELSLKPLGMVTVTQAIIHHLKVTDGVPPTAILLEVYPTKVTVTVVKLGKIKASEEVGRSGDLSKDVEEALTRLNMDQLPPRFLLTNGSNLENEQQQLISYSWKEKLSFLHLPKVEVLPIDFSIEAIALSGGLEVVKALGVGIEQKDLKEKDSVPSPPSLTASSELKDIGFKVEEIESPLPPPPVSKKPLINEKHHPEKTSSTPEIPKDKEKPISSHQSKTPLSFSRLFESFSSFFSNIKNFFVSKSLFNHWFIYPLLIFILLLITTISYLFFGKARVVITLPSQTIEETGEIILSTISQPNTVLVELKNISSQTSQTVTTTGEATVGDKASGKVTVYNRTIEPITLASGVNVISDSDNLVYTLDTEITIASKSSDLISGEEKFGKATGVAVTADRIGVDYNILQNTNFTVDKYSKTILYAIGENDFSGGSSRAVKAVSQEDKETLLSSATEEVEQSIHLQTKQQNIDLIPIMLGEIQFDQQNFDKEIGEEADELSLDLSANFQVLICSKSELIDYLNQEIKKKSSDSRVLALNKTNFEFSYPEHISGDNYSSQLKTTGVLIPEIETDLLIEQIVATSVNKAQEKLKQSTNFESVIIFVKPKIPFLSKMLPARKNNITLEIIVPD